MIREITTVPTLRCNLSCGYCIQRQAIDNHPARQTKSHFHESSIEIWQDFIGKISKPTRLVFSGGEPFLYKGFQKLALSITNRNVTAPLIIITNLFAPVKDMNELLDCNIQFIISLHNSLSKHQTEEFLDKLKVLNHKNISIRILTDFSDEDRLTFLMKFMNRYKIKYILGLIYKINQGKFEEVNGESLENLHIKNFNSTKEEYSYTLKKNLMRLIPFWVRALILQSGGAGSIDLEAIRNFILFPDYYCAPNTKMARCRIPHRHLTVYPDGSIWACNIYLKNAFQPDFTDDFTDIVCPDFGHCIETCTTPPFAEELVAAESELNP
jgi:organic radical activating enzyme